MLDNDSEQDLYLLHDGEVYTHLLRKDTLKSQYKLYRASNSIGTNDIRDEDFDDFIFRNYVDEDDVSLIDILSGSTLVNEIKTPTKIVKGEDLSRIYTIMPVKQDEVAGYGMTLLVYPDELIG